MGPQGAPKHVRAWRGGRKQYSNLNRLQGACSPKHMHLKHYTWRACERHPPWVGIPALAGSPSVQKFQSPLVDDRKGRVHTHTLANKAAANELSKLPERAGWHGQAERPHSSPARAHTRGTSNHPPSCAPRGAGMRSQGEVRQATTCNAPAAIKPAVRAGASTSAPGRGHAAVLEEEKAA